MPCASPVTIQSGHGPIQVRCKQCLSCRIQRQSGIALQAKMEDAVSLCGDFWTLTYQTSPEVLDYSDFSKFLKRLRKWNRTRGNPLPIRYLGVGEYGSKTGRPHFHALIFNSLPVSNQKALAAATLRKPSSPEGSLMRLWPHGFAYIGEVTPASINYTARYCLKFGLKGEEGMAHWSLKPVLGSGGIRELAAYMRKRGDKLTEPPSALRIEGKNYSCNEAMRTEFWREFTGNEDAKPSKRLAVRHMEWLANMRYGDPVAAQRRARANRDQFWESAQVIKETL